MKPTGDQPKAPESKPESKPKASEPKLGSKPKAPDPKDDLKTLPMPEVEKKLGSSPKGLSQAEAQKRLAQYGPNEIAEKKDQSIPKVLNLFLGTHSVDDRRCRDSVGSSSALAGFLHHSLSSFFQCFGRILGGTSRGKRNCRVARPSLRPRPGSCETESGTRQRFLNWCPATLFACDWETSCRRMRVCWPAIQCKLISPP